MSQPIRILKLVPTGERYRAEISTLESPIVIPAEIVHRHALKADIVLTPSQLEMLQAEAELIECDRSAARLLGSREHTVGELKLKLIRKQFGRETVEKTIKNYRARGLLDDAHLAHKLVAQALEKNPAGRRWLIAMLRRKHIAGHLAEQAVEMALAAHDEIELAKTSLRKRWSSISQLELERARTKAYNYLSRRGISYNSARAAFEQLYNHDHKDDDH